MEPGARSRGRPSAASASATTRPCAAPATVVKMMTEKAGFMPARAADCVGSHGFEPSADPPARVDRARGRYWLAGLRLPLGHQRVAAALADRLRDLGVRILHVAEQPRAGRAGLDAGGLAVVRRQLLVVDAVDAQRALGHHLALLVELARAVGAGPRAVLAADALVVVDQHDAVFLALVARAGRAHRHARRVLAVQAALREVDRLGAGEAAGLVGLHAVEEGAGRARRRRGSRRPAGRRCPRCSIPCTRSRRRGSRRRRSGR